MSTHVLIAGVSARAAAESAARADFRVTAIDAFGDLDRHPGVRSLSLPRDFDTTFSAVAAARAAREVECDAVAYVSNFENHPRAVRTLAGARTLWGNPPDVLRRVRDPALLARALRHRGFSVPALWKTPNDLSDPNASKVWLVKPLRSGGGRRVRMWRGGVPLPRGCYLQEVVDGTPGSVVFAAAGGRAVPLGISRQLIGESAFGAAGFAYCGSILASAGDAQFAHDGALVRAALGLAREVTEEFDLVGVNAVDFIARDGVPYPIEVNPRWSASMELVERVFGLSVFRAHADACSSGVLPDSDLVTLRRGMGAVGKAVVFSRHDVTVGDTRPWLDDSSVRDVPHRGERIRAGSPVCTVFARGSDSASCHAALERRAERVYAEIADWERAAA